MVSTGLFIINIILQAALVAYGTCALFQIVDGFIPTKLVGTRATKIWPDTYTTGSCDVTTSGRLKLFNNRSIYQRKQRYYQKLYVYHNGNDSDSDTHNNNVDVSDEDNNNNNKISLQQDANHRRNVLSKLHSFTAAMITSAVPSISGSKTAAFATITDETDNFASNWWTTPSSDAIQKQLQQPQIDDNNTDDTDIVSIQVSKSDLLKGNSGLGIELADIEFRTNVRVYVKSIQSNSYGSKLGIQPNWIVVSINDESMERTNSKGVATYLRQAITTNTSSDIITLRFRDPSVFRSKLQNFNNNNNDDNNKSTTKVVTTQVAPAGDTSIYNRDGTKLIRDSYQGSDQKIRVSQLITPPTPNRSTSGALCTKQAEIDDLLEISYTGTVVETGYIFDGSAIKINGNGIPGRGDDVTLYFVLGKQPFGQFPPGWDVGLIGTCVGERRRIIVPPALGYGPTGLPRRNIPPNATLQYDVTLVSLNGVSTIQ